MAAAPILSTCVDLRDIDDRKDRPEKSPLDDVQRDACVFIKEMGEGRCSSQYKKRDTMLSPPTSKTVRALIPSRGRSFVSYLALCKHITKGFRLQPSHMFPAAKPSKGSTSNMSC
jgi:hypothetical protein